MQRKKIAEFVNQTGIIAPGDILTADELSTLADRLSTLSSLYEEKNISNDLNNARFFPLRYDIALWHFINGDTENAKNEMTGLIKDINIHKDYDASKYEMRCGYASILANTNEMKEALKILEYDILEASKELGKLHPTTLELIGVRAECYIQEEEYDLGINDYKRLVEDCIQVFGREHPITLRNRAKLTYYTFKSQIKNGVSFNAEDIAKKYKLLKDGYNSVTDPHDYSKLLLVYEYIEILNSSGNLSSDDKNYINSL